METSQGTTELHLEDIEGHRPRATTNTWFRLVNFLVDSFIFYIVMMLLQFFVILPLTVGSLPDFFRMSMPLGLPSLYVSLVMLFWACMYVLYYTVQETFLDGQTLGKRLTGTEVVSIRGANLTFNKALLRSICRLIPVDPIIALTGRPLHDRLSGTTVVYV